MSAEGTQRDNQRTLEVNYPDVFSKARLGVIRMLVLAAEKPGSQRTGKPENREIGKPGSQRTGKSVNKK